MKGLYEQELSDARKLLDDTAKEKAQLQIDVGKLKSDNEDLRLKWVERNPLKLILLCEYIMLHW